MDRYTIQIGHDWQGDAYWSIYDRALRLTVARYQNLADAQAFIASPSF
jgi:hypothetical protein